jgi:hypothetical protein
MLENDKRFWMRDFVLRFYDGNPVVYIPYRRLAEDLLYIWIEKPDDTQRVIHLVFMNGESVPITITGDEINSADEKVKVCIENFLNAAVASYEMWRKRRVIETKIT